MLNLKAKGHLVNLAAYLFLEQKQNSISMNKIVFRVTTRTCSSCSIKDMLVEVSREGSHVKYPCKVQTVMKGRCEP